jgi:rubrerythrin
VDPRVIQALQDARRAEKAQALYYRALAAKAEDAGDEQAEEDLNGLHADEQHHLARITVRLVEAKAAVDDLKDVPIPTSIYPDWQEHASAREEAEIARYEALLKLALDEGTAALVQEMLAVERKHAESLGGKYMSA